MWQENNSNQVQSVLHEQGRIRKEIRNAENSVNYEEIRQTSGSQTHISEECTPLSQAPESGGDQFHYEHGLLENMKSNIWACGVKTSEELRNLIVSIKEQEKQVQKLLEVRELREKNASEAKDRNEAMSLELHISQGNLQELESQ
jgi:hypothetical protein